MFGDSLPTFITSGDSSPTFINTSNLFLRRIGRGRNPLFAILVIAVSGVEDVTTAICDSCNNLMSRVSLGLAPCLFQCVDQLGFVSVWPVEERDSPAVC